MLRTTRLCSRAILIASLAAATPAAANLLLNASFESGPAVPSGEEVLVPGSTALPGWEVGGAGIEYIGDVYWVASAGTRSLALNAADRGTVSQTFATVTGARYDVAFSISGEPFTTPVVKRMRVTAAGQSHDVSFDSAPAWHWDMQWSRRTWSFVAGGTTTTLTFESLDAGEWSPTLDDVDVVQATTDAPPGTPALGFEPPAPNPAPGPTILAFTLPAPGPTELRVFDAQGRLLSDLVHGPREAGRHRIRWDGLGEYGDPLSAGVYFAVLRHGGRTFTQRIVRTR